MLAHAASVITSQSEDFNTLSLLHCRCLLFCAFVLAFFSRVVLLQISAATSISRFFCATTARRHLRSAPCRARDTTSLQQSGLKTSKHISVRHLFCSLSPDCSENNQQAGSHPHLTATCVFAKTQVSERKVKEGGGGQVVKSKKQTWPLGQLS